MGDFKDSNVTTGCVANIDCRMCNPKSMREIAVKLEDAINSNKGTSAAAMLMHWARGTGQAVFWDVKLLRDNEEFFSNNNVLDTEEISRERYRKAILKYFLNEPSVFWKEKYLHTMEAGATDIWSKDYESYRGYQLYTRGKFKFLKEEKKEKYTITATIEYNWFDPYDWHDDKGPADYAALWYGISDDNLKVYENCGYAKPFIMYSTWYQSMTLTFTKEELKNPISILDNIVWDKVLDGKAPEEKIGSLDLWREEDHIALTTNYTDEQVAVESNLANFSKEQLLELPHLRTDLTEFELPFFKEDLSKTHIHYKIEGTI